MAHNRDRSFDAVIARRGERLQSRVMATASPETLAHVLADQPFFKPVDALAQAVADRGQRFVSFGHYDYLGLAHHPQVTAAGKAALETHGSGAGASRLVGGERLAHRAFERNLAGFLGVGATLAIISGYLANLSLIPHLIDGQDLLVVDELAHNSIMTASRAGTFRTRTFAHNDCDALDALLQAERGNYRNVLIVTEGLFSMDGDIPDLPHLIDIKTRHSAWLMLDEAHSFGVLGPYGRGLSEHYGIDPKAIDISVGTLSKSFASSGGFIAASADVIEYLRYTLPGFIFSVGLSPVTVATAQAALAVLQAEPERVARLRDNSGYFLSQARAAGFDTAHARGEAVVPILFHGSEATLAASRALEQAGVYVPPVVLIGVPSDKPRLRFFLSAAHDRADIDRVFAALAPLA